MWLHNFALSVNPWKTAFLIEHTQVKSNIEELFKPDVQENVAGIFLPKRYDSVLKRP